MAFLSAGLGQYQSTKPHSLYTRKKERLAKSRQGIIYCPGLTGTALSWRDGVEINETWEACADYRFRLASISEEIQWGNTNIMTKMDNMYAYATANWGFRRKVHLLAASGGGVCVLNWARFNPDKVASIAAVIPAIDIQDIHDNARTATIGLPDATYGPKVAYSSARPPDFWNPPDNTSAYTSIPILIYYGANDPVCVPAVANAFGAATGARLVQLPGGHSSVGMVANDVRDFFKAHAHHP